MVRNRDVGWGNVKSAAVTKMIDEQRLPIETLRGRRYAYHKARHKRSSMPAFCERA